MTTKKQRREQVAARRAIYDAETLRMGQEALATERAKREQKEFEAQRPINKKRAKDQMKGVANASH